MSAAGQAIDPMLSRAQQNAPPDPMQARAAGQNIAPPPSSQDAQVSPMDTGAANSGDWRTQLRGSAVGSIEHGMMDGVYGALQLSGKGESAVTSLGGLYPNPVSRYFDDAVSNLDKTRQLDDTTYRQAQTVMGRGQGFEASRLLGNILSPVNAVGGEISTGSKLANALLRGGYYGATQPVDDTNNFWTQKGIQTGMGAGSGGLLHGVGSVASSVVAPKISDAAQTLLNAKVPLTVGQIMGGSAQRLEDSATSIPFVGDMVKARQREAFIGLNTASINRALDPIGQTLPAGMQGHQAIEYAQNALGDAYDTLLPSLSATADRPLATDLNDIVNNATQKYGLVGASKDKLESIVKNQVIGKSNAGSYDGATLKDIQSNLSYQARVHSKSLNPDDKNLADALIDTKSAFNDFIARQNPNEAPLLAAINEGWANFARPQAAAEKATKDGVFTPAQLAMAIRMGGARSQNATGGALMQDLSSAGQMVLPSTVPDSGTPFRHAVEAGLGLAGAGLGGEHFIPGSAEAASGAAALGALLAAGGTRTAQNIFRTALTKRPANAAKLAEALMNSAPRLTSGVMPLLLAQPSNESPK